MEGNANRATRRELVQMIQNARDNSMNLINPAAYTHTSVAIQTLCWLPESAVEVHLSNPKRESFRHTSLIGDIVVVAFQVFKNSYRLSSGLD